ncbi:MAG: aminoacyl-tRNA hydrolase [Omnitrophica WOR_2 bacterium RIFCSPHIGHO2_01_FULL_52_10]|nr:MAG: aminoacyl-tRNA hydrolase [Omnitrophica WOR_2 bacterium RIFCSPHIGHO2_01_FULL_52_10]
MSQARLIAGLGNPGRDYEYTRHNLGFLVVEHLAQKNNLRFRKSSFTNGLTAEGKVAGNDLCCLLPATYMNNSGAAVKQAVLNKNLDHTDILIVCDDFHLDFGQVRIRSKGTGGGHNGLTSVIEHLGTQAFARLRLGIGGPVKGQESVEYVLGKWTAGEEKQLDEFIDRATDCCGVWLQEGIDKAMDQFNGRS